VSWLDDTDDDDEEFDEADIRVRPNPKANRPRTKRRPAHSDARIGRVLGVDRGRYAVLIGEDTPDEHEAVAMRARELRKQPIVTGDRARIVGDTSGDGGTLGRIVGIEERTSLLRRSADDTDQVERIVVANADQMLIVVAAADPEPRPRLVDRYLVAALDAGIRPLLVVTKTDLTDPSGFLAHFDGLDLEVFTSARDEMPVERIGQALVGHSTVFVGHSGVGKSTLVNALVPTAQRATGHVNVVTGRGRHTSSSTVSLRYRGEGGGGVQQTFHGKLLCRGLGLAAPV
jgi:ribosome biogenesis GTPase